MTAMLLILASVLVLAIVVAGVMRAVGPTSDPKEHRAIDKESPPDLDKANTLDTGSVARHRISYTVVCPRCGSTDFDYPANPTPEDTIVCTSCGNHSLYADILAEAKKKAIEQINGSQENSDQSFQKQQEDHAGECVVMSVSSPRNLIYAVDTVSITVRKDKTPWVELTIGDPFNQTHSFNVQTKRWKPFSPFLPGASKELLDSLSGYWTQINGEIQLETKQHPGKEVAINFVPYLCKIKTSALAIFPENISIKSFTQDISYSVNLSKLTCTCPDFRESRSFMEIHNPLRLCKHLVQVLDEKCEETRGAFIDDILPLEIRWCSQYKRGINPNMILQKGALKVEGKTIEFYVKYVKGDWLNVFYPDPFGVVGRFGFIPWERAWGGQNPFPEGTKRKVNSALLALYESLGPH